ncbi:MAG: cell division protein SepF [Candidatus Lokiarchaeota archaeon]|nr:cell division protein SepF [Candidatus Harpocratesius repetitus]
MGTTSVDQRSSKPVYIRKLDLQDQRDLRQISENLAKNRILFVQTKKFFEQHQNDLITLKNTMNQLKQICLRNGGSIGRVGDDILVLTPNPNIKLY